MKDRIEQNNRKDDSVVQGKDAKGAADVEVAGAVGLIARESKRMPVMRNPERTKKMLTPVQPHGIAQ